METLSIIVGVILLAVMVKVVLWIIKKQVKFLFRIVSVLVTLVLAGFILFQVL